MEGNYESYLAAIAVMETVRHYPEPYDAVIQAGYGEHGREGLQELLDVPVVDITEAAASTAMFLGHTYSVVTTLDRTVPLIQDRLKLAGLSDRCASVRASGMAVLDLEHDPEAAVEAIALQAARTVEEDRAEVICLGCGGMAGLMERVRAATGVPVVDGVDCRGDHRGGTRPDEPEHVEGPDLRAATAEEVQGLAPVGRRAALNSVVHRSTAPRRFADGALSCARRVSGLVLHRGLPSAGSARDDGTSFDKISFGIPKWAVGR